MVQPGRLNDAPVLGDAAHNRTDLPARLGEELSVPTATHYETLNSTIWGLFLLILSNCF